ncbi:putative receptor-like protein kinase [Hibiscus syriacus]|uniref:Receptor-like protein kinase n=1 Tax=Hibiscus syriacus TaxID=106335 RepID=A0A6A2WC88_HIBSY|nr:putative receptor-like protein kinase [Hibiscus syriacus]
MVVKKLTWKSLMLSCCTSNESSVDSVTGKMVLKPCQFQRLLLLDVGDPSSRICIDNLPTSLISSNLHVFSVSELRLITHNFARCNLLGEGYSGTLQWSTRMKIALGASKGLAFLHEADKPVIYRDFKSSNILLDSDYNCKLSDFGLAKDGPEIGETHVTTRVMGTQGYAAPEYIMTGHMTTMSDVYSFGVVLLELLTGMRSMENTGWSREPSLVEWARPLLRDRKRLDRVSNRGPQKVAALACKCLTYHPQLRPTMGEVVKVLESVQGFDDEFIGPFVNVVSSETDGSKEFLAKKEDQHCNRDNGPHRRGWRKRIKLPLASVANAESPCSI